MRLLLRWFLQLFEPVLCSITFDGHSGRSETFLQEREDHAFLSARVLHTSQGKHIVRLRSTEDGRKPLLGVVKPLDAEIDLSQRRQRAWDLRSSFKACSASSTARRPFASSACSAKTRAKC
jgi:hypothetical protein